MFAQERVENIIFKNKKPNVVIKEKKWKHQMIKRLRDLLDTSLHTKLFGVILLKSYID